MANSRTYISISVTMRVFINLCEGTAVQNYITPRGFPADSHYGVLLNGYLYRVNYIWI